MSYSHAYIDDFIESQKIINKAIKNMENEKKIFVRIENYTGDKPIVIREDAPQRALEPIQATVPGPICDYGTIETPYRFLEKKKHLIDIDKCSLNVNREERTLKLYVNDTHSRKAYDPYEELPYDYTGGSVTGGISYTKEFKDLHINDGQLVNPVKLAKFFRLNRHLFPDKEELGVLIAKLKNVEAKISGDYKKECEEHGTISKTEYYSMHVSHNLPESFTMNFAIFKGSPKENYEIEIDADIVDGHIMVALVSPAVNSEKESQNDKLINEELEKIAALCPELLIIEE